MSWGQRKQQRMILNIALFGWLWVIGLSDVALASRNNPLPGVTGGPAGASATCMDCHGSAAGGGSVTIIGAPATYQPSAVYDLIVRVADASQVGAGFELSIENAGGHVGSLIVTDAIPHAATFCGSCSV